ncbi:MAG: hypothetical protein ACE5I7_10805 [Candidatus Binatia bacterium]
MSPAGRPAATRSPIPYAQTLLALEVSQLTVLARAVRLLFHTAHSRPYQERVDPGAGATALHDPGSFGVFMGYDFHLTEDGPRLIEINTNAGGALLNRLHTASLCDPRQLDWLCCDPPPVSQVEERIAETFRAEIEAARGKGVTLRTVAIVDQRPDEQFLRPEFELFRELFARHGVDARICDTAELVRGAGGGIEVGGTPIDLVYLRDTDFYLASLRTAALREAYLTDKVVVTPCPREHHLLADKRRLEIFSSAETLEGLGLAPEDAAFLAEIVPETRPLHAMSFDEAWRTRRDWVFKPAAAFGSKAVYRGDKISRRRLDQLYGERHFLAQRRVAPGMTQVDTPQGSKPMKFDIRAYAYRDEIFLLGARVYEGQVTNFRSPGGGFSAICVARDGAL